MIGPSAPNPLDPADDPRFVQANESGEDEVKGKRESHADRQEDQQREGRTWCERESEIVPAALLGKCFYGPKRGRGLYVDGSRHAFTEGEVVTAGRAVRSIKPSS
jgi:hypothetical protein